MAVFSLKGTEHETDRLEVFSDAVFAIAITVPVVELRAPRPEDGDLAAAYLKLAPDYAAYVLSVILIGLYWSHSHFSGKLLEKTDHGYNLLTIGFLLRSVSLHFPRASWSNISVEMRTARPPPFGTWA
ncbi:TMEM175 family protein [Microbacterium sp. NPDC089313]|uniref:TMEM175 family protein n=1 Tax=Microbacterium sp. NPDC089313 TaxID=3154973 RepID=UPI00341EA6EB